jgi:hypothetical protein
MNVEEAEELPEALVLHLFIPAEADLEICHGVDPETEEPGTLISIIMAREVFDTMQEFITEKRLEMEFP